MRAVICSCHHSTCHPRPRYVGFSLRHKSIDSMYSYFCKATWVLVTGNVAEMRELQLHAAPLQLLAGSFLAYSEPG